MKVSSTTSKFIEEWIKRYASMGGRSIQSAETLESIVVESIKESGLALTGTRAYIRIRENERIYEGISAAFDRLEEDKRVFIHEYYWGSTKKTVESAARAAFVVERTGKRWKKEFIEEIAQRLGWF